MESQWLRPQKKTTPSFYPCCIPEMARGETASRWYHVEVGNKRRMSRATDTQVCLIAVDEPNAAGQFVRRSTGAIPLTVRHEGIARPGRVVGSPVQWNLCSVARDSPQGGPFFALHPVVAPTDIKLQTNQPFKTAYILQAQSIEVDSKPLRVEVAWNGKWSEDTAVMTSHLVVKSAVLTRDQL
jgi:hypothetical protein